VSFSGSRGVDGGDQAAVRVADGGRIIEGYSLTEGMMACLVNPMKGNAKIGLDRPSAARCRARIVETEHGLTDARPREEGELC
jgi:hypothetical protein